MEDAEVGEQFAVVPVPDSDQELAVEVSAANGDVGIDDQTEFTFSASYVTQPEVSCDLLKHL